MRSRAIYMIFRLATAYDASMETVSHSIVLLDRLIAKGHAHDLVTAALACFLIAAKILETRHPCVQDLARMGFCSPNQVLAAEIAVLSALEWDVHVVTKGFDEPSPPQLPMAAPAS